MVYKQHYKIAYTSRDQVLSTDFPVLYNLNPTTYKLIISFKILTRLKTFSSNEASL